MRTNGRRGADRPAGDDGSAVADFAMVSGLVSLLFLAVLQIGLALHIRNTLIECASEGARYGARADNQPGDGVARAQSLIRASLAAAYARDVTPSTEVVDGVRVVEITVVAPLPLIGPLGPGGAMTVHGRAFAENQ